MEVQTSRISGQTNEIPPSVVFHNSNRFRFKRTFAESLIRSRVIVNKCFSLYLGMNRDFGSHM